MKRFAAILVVQFVVIFAAAFLGSWAFSHWRGAAAPTPTQASTDELSWFRSALGLDAAQAARLETLHRAFEAEQARLCEQHCAARVELARLIKSGRAVTPQMEALSKTMCDLEAKSERLTLDHIFAVGLELNAAQREKFVAKVYDEMCHSCPMGMHNARASTQASCGSSGCVCCVASGEQAPAPAKPVAQPVPMQPRWDALPAKMAAGFPAAELTPYRQPGNPILASISSRSLFLLFSVFRI